MEGSSTKPVKVFRANGLSVSVFKNTAKTKDDRDTTFYKVSLQRSYKDGETYRNTTSLGRDDLPVAALLLPRAWEYIVTTQEQERKDA